MGKISKGFLLLLWLLLAAPSPGDKGRKGQADLEQSMAFTGMKRSKGALLELRSVVENIKAIGRSLYFSSDLPSFDERFAYGACLEKEGRWTDAFLEYMLVEDGLGLPGGPNIDITYFYYTRGISAAHAGFMQKACEDALSLHLYGADPRDDVYFDHLVGYASYLQARMEIEKGEEEKAVLSKSAYTLLTGASAFFKRAWETLLFLGLKEDAQAFMPALRETMMCAKQYNDVVQILEKGEVLDQEGMLAFAKSLYLLGDYERAFGILRNLFDTQDARGSLDDMAKSAFWLGWAALRLGDIENGVRYLSKSEHLSLPYENYAGMTRLSLAWISYRLWAQGKGSIGLTGIYELLHGVEIDDLLALSCRSSCDPPPVSMEEIVVFLSDFLFVVASLGLKEASERALLLLTGCI